MSITYNYLASQVPPLIAPPTATIGGGTGSGPAFPFAAGMQDPGVSNRLNQYAVAIPNVLSYCGGAGYGVASGLAVSNPSGLNVAVGTGVAYVGYLLEIVASNPFGPQILPPTPVTLPDNSTSFVWLTSTGGLADSTSQTPPTNAVILLATVITASGAVTNIDYTGRPSVVGSSIERTTADVGAPTDTPAATARFTTFTLAGQYVWNGTSYNPVGPTAVSVSTASSVTLTTLSATNQVLTPTANIIVFLPATPMPFVISNGATAASGYTITVQNSLGTATLCVLYGGYSATIPVINGGSGSGASYPANVKPDNGNSGCSIFATGQGGISSSASPITFALNSAGGPIRVCVVQNSDPAVAISSVTFNGVALTVLNSGAEASFGIVYQYYALTSAVGTYNVVITFGSSTTAQGFAEAIIGPSGISLGAYTDGNSGSATSSPLTLAANPGDIVLDCVIATHTVTTSQTLCQPHQAIGSFDSATSYAFGLGGTTTMDYTFASGEYAMAAMVFTA